MTEAKVRGILSKGVLLIDICTSSMYSDEIRAAALMMMRQNVIGLQWLKKEAHND